MLAIACLWENVCLDLLSVFLLGCLGLLLLLLLSCMLLLLLLLSRFSRVRLCATPPGSPVPGILQARTLEWFVISFSNAWKGKVKVWLFVTPWSAAYQAWAICTFWKLNPYQSHHLQIFSPSLFILFLISFPVQNLISLIRSHLLCLFVILTVLFTSVAYNSLMT